MNISSKTDQNLHLTQLQHAYTLSHVQQICSIYNKKPD